MNGYVDIPSRALQYLRSRHPDAPSDPDRYAVLSIKIDRETPPAIVTDGWWNVCIDARWHDNDGDSYVTLNVPLRKLLADEYMVVSELTEPLW